jgi:pantoate--beta-alanine ligase
MQVFREIAALRAFLNPVRVTKTIGLVPTMGALHQGHLALIAESKKTNDLTVATIFVNPTQFNNAEDLEKYPRTFEEDCRKLESSGCEVLFFPSVKEMYPIPSSLTMNFGSLNEVLEGKFRPGHFSGVGLVVSKLFHIVQPTRAYFGQKDFQQFMVIKKLVEELCLPVELMRVPTLREPDGLAMSSRNLRLNTNERQRAAILYQALQEARRQVKQQVPWKKIVDQISEMVSRSDIRLEYLALADTENLEATENVTDVRPKVLLIAAYVGDVRLIDNVLLDEN